MFKILDGREQFYQWDSDRQIVIEDIDCNEVHFSNRTDKTALVCTVREENGQVIADVPNILLQQDWPITVYAFDQDYTKYSQTFKVMPRTKPDDYVYTETDVLNYNTLAQKIDDIEENIGTEIEEYLKENPPEAPVQSVNNKTGDVVLTAEDVGAATTEYVDKAVEDIELTPGPQGEPGKDGAQGPAGKDGADGSDGATFYPSVSSDGTLSWTNDGGKVNPTPVNIRGPQGQPGADGQQGIQGVPGPQGPAGADGQDGQKGDKGDPGVGVPAGGTIGQVLTKKSNTDYDTEWTDQTGGGSGTPGEDGGYYTPAVDSDGNLTWTGSKEDMPAVPSSNIKGPQGNPGQDGIQGPAGQDGKDGAPGEKGDKGDPGQDGAKGDPGEDGYSPVATVIQTETGATISITDKTGTTTATITNGQDGTDGQDGAPGQDGHTPIKGTDYWTESDKAEIVQEAASSIPIATTEVAGRVKPDGTTVTITEDGTISAVGGGSGGASTAAQVSFDDSTAAIGATNVQDAIEYLADSGATTEVVQDMISENLTDYPNLYNTSDNLQPIYKASELSDGTVISQLDFGMMKAVRYLEWDRETGDTALYTNMMSDIETSANFYKYPFQKGHTYMIWTAAGYTSNNITDLRRSLMFLERTFTFYTIPTTQEIFLPITIAITDSTNPTRRGRDLYFIKDITPINQAQVNELATKINSLVDGNEVSY